MKSECMLPVEHRTVGTTDHNGWSFELSLGSEYISEQPYHLQQLLGKPIVRLADDVPNIASLVFRDRLRKV